MREIGENKLDKEMCVSQPANFLANICLVIDVILVFLL